MAKQHYRTIPREIRRRIYMSRGAHGGYAVHHDMPGEAIVCEVPTYDMALRIVQALRDRANSAKAGA